LKTIHLVSFNNPYPPDYGGVMDVFYKVKALHEAGIAVILHVFEFNRPHSPEMEKFCEAVYYYPRKTGWLSQFSILPYIVISRKSSELLANLCNDQYPVLFEGLHTCLYLNHSGLRHKQKLVRMHNIEHEYYSFLSMSTRNLKKKLFYKIESLKLKRFEKILRFADNILPISLSDTSYFEKKYGKTIFVGAFHPNREISSSEGKGKYILMHGNLKVEENEKAVFHCIRNILKNINFPVVIAGKDPSDLLRNEISLHPNIILSENPDEAEMDRLQHEAHIHLCYTFQASGLKLKLLNSLYKGRFVVANPLMTEGSGLRDLTLTGESDKELIDIIKSLIPCALDAGQIAKREKIMEIYDYKQNAVKISSLLSNDLS
jgi:hypothetical protein